MPPLTVPARFVSQVGMRIYHKLKNHYHCPIINLDKLWTLVGEEVRPAQCLVSGDLSAHRSRLFGANAGTARCVLL